MVIAPTNIRNKGDKNAMSIFFSYPQVFLTCSLSYLKLHKLNMPHYRDKSKIQNDFIFFLCTLFLLSVALFFNSLTNGHAQQTAVEEYVKTTQQSWQVKCLRPIKKDAASKEQCFMVQENADEDDPSISASIVILETAPKSFSIRITVPLGVFLPKALKLKIDDKDVGSVPYIYCFAAGCLVESTMPDILTDKFKKGQTASLTFFAANQQKLEMPISLSGFTKAYKILSDPQ